MSTREELTYEEALTTLQVELEKHLDPPAASNILDRIDDIIQAKASEIQSYLIDIEIQDTRVKLSRDLSQHRHGQTGEVLQPYEVRE